MNIDQLNTYRLIQAGSEHVLPLLEKRRANVLSLIVSKYKGGERDFVGEAAELSVIADIESQLKQNTAKLNNMEKERSDDTTNR